MLSIDLMAELWGVYLMGELWGVYLMGELCGVYFIGELWVVFCELLGENWRVIVVHHFTGLILGLRPANERRRYFVTTSLIGRAQT